jgi:hypothetical protein
MRLGVALDRRADVAEGVAGADGWSTPSISASWVMSISRSALRLGVPATYMRELSPYQPSTITVTSMLRMSPSFSFRSDGMPWQTTWLIEMQEAWR